MITVSELGALQRFEPPRQLTAYLGLVPSESTRTACQSWCWQQLRTAAMRFQSFDRPLSVIEYPLPAKFCYIDFMKILHAEVRESEEAAEITRKFGWEVHNDQIEPGSFGGMCDAAWTTEAQFHRR